MKSKKQALAKSLLALLLCVAMLVSTTFAWFTDSVVSGINTIAAGNLDVELYHSNAAVSDEKVDASTKLFLDLQGNPILWEPGVVSYENLRVTNEGDLALIYQLAIITANENYILDNGAQYGLSQVLKVGVVEGGITATDRAAVVASVGSWTTLSAFLAEGDLLADGEETWGIVIYWQPSDNDNNWNANNGKQLSSGDALTIDLGVKLTATQMVSESDSFGDDYDAAAKDDVFPSFEGGTAGVPVTPDANGNTAEAVTITVGDITATVPAGVKLADGVTSLSLTVDEMAFSESNVVLGENEASRSLNVHVEGVAADNTTPITITLPAVAPVALNMSNYKVYHVEGGATNEMTLVANDADFTAHNQFKYDPATGDVTLYMASFSEVLFVAEDAKWEGKYDYSWYDASKTQLYIANADQLAGFSAIVGGMNGYEKDSFAGKTVTLVAHIDLNDLDSENGYVFYPIGYYNSTGSYEKKSNVEVTSSVSSFEGTFDGNGYTIKNFYQNTWEMFGDYNDGYSGTPNHYKDAMGLFGYVYGGTVKNLTVDNFSSDGEFTPTGVIAAYADNSTFENIAITNCNPRVYNTGNGGIIGIAGERGEAADQKITLKNVTVDNTNKISALWGSWDVACGGLVGMFRGNAEGGQGKIHFEDCRVSAQIDVNNDVCANYQYYAYRYAGMLIGSVRSNVSGDDGHVYPNMDGITTANCTVNYGTWNNYYYCELVANSLASYTHDHQMSRLTQVSAVNGTTIVPLEGETFTVPATGRYNYVVVNGNHSTENATCYHFVDGVLWTHDQAGTETVEGEGTVLKEDKQHLYLPFVDQLVTGDGWGVTSRGIGDVEGLQNVTPGSQEASVEKWNGKTVGTLLTHKTIKLGDLFAANDASVPILDGSVYVAVTDAQENAAPISAKVVRNGSDWKQTTLVLEGYGKAQITIQDYYFCKPTTIVVDVQNPLTPIIDQNCVVNGDFENGNAYGWTTHQSTEISASAAYSDLYGINLKGNGGWGGMLNQTFNVEVGKKYALSFWIRVIDNGVNIQIKKVNEDGADMQSEWHSSTEWVKKVYTFVAETETICLNFCGGGNGKAENVYVDDIILEKIMYVVNGHFEYGESNWQYKSGSHELVTDSHGGNYAMKLTDPGQYGEAAVSDAITVVPGKTYAIKWYSKRLSYNTYVNDEGQTKISTFNMYIIGSYKHISGQNWMANTSSNWIEHKYVFKAVSDTIQLKFSAEASTPPGSIIIDDVRMYELKDPNQTGLLLDGDFETGDADYWNATQDTAVVTAAAYTGDYGIKLAGNGGWGGMASQTFNTVAGNTYTVTLWAKAVSEGVNVSFIDSNKQKLLNDQGKQIGKWITNTEWTQYTLTFTATTSTTTINFNGGNTGVAEIVYVDDITVTEN